MAKIIWRGIIKSEEDFPTSEIPDNAKKLEVEEDMKKMQIKAFPFMIPSVVICCMCMFLKTSLAGQRVIDFIFLIIGFIIGFVLIIVHELLHAIAFPKNATVYIGIMPKGLAALALSSSPIKKSRFIFMSILPIILGVIPLIIFCITSYELKQLNGILFGLAVTGMTSVYPDLYNIAMVLKNVPKNATIQNNKNETYYY